jgi:ATP-dependent Lhr-like helicase
MSRRWLSPESAADLGRLDADAISRVRAEAWPDAANADELHDALVWLGFLSASEADAQPGWNDWLADLVRQQRVTRLEAPAGMLWISAERLPEFRALWPTSTSQPAIMTPAAYAARVWSRDEALVEILRGRLEGQGPVTQDALAGALGLGANEIAPALATLQAEGFAMRGEFTSGASEEWCERRLLARINGYTVKRLRAEIEPVAACDFLRFLLTWQCVAPDVRMEGPDAVDAIVGQLEGFEAPAGAWETEILPARLAGYEPHWLDDRCLAGHVAWARLRPRHGRGNGNGLRPAPVRTTPITLLTRRHAAVWGLLSPDIDATEVSPRAEALVQHIRQHGASFFDDLASGTGLLRSQAEEALAELVAVGLVSSDSFGGLRALLVPSSERRPIASGRRRRRTVTFGMEAAGRWTLARHPGAPKAESPAQARAREEEAVEYVARALLRRYGVVFWRLLEREAAWLPPWRDLLRVYRRLESRGDVRGGRFVAGFSGEQYALPSAVSALRQMRRQPELGTLVSLSAADPLNLVGILTPGPRLAATTGNRLLYRDGLPIALLSSGNVQFLDSMNTTGEWEAYKALLRASPGPSLTPDGIGNSEPAVSESS